MTTSLVDIFTLALGLQTPWKVSRADLDIAKGRIDFDLSCDAKRLGCPECGAADQKIHDRLNRAWRHLDFFQYEAWLHAKVPRIACGECGKTAQVPVPWARPDSGFTLLFEAFSLALCQTVTVAQAAEHLRVAPKRLWKRIDHYVTAARAEETMDGVSLVGIDEKSVKRGHEYVTLVHDLERKKLLFITPGRKHGTVAEFKKDLVAHGGDPEQIRHVCMDMGPAYIKGVTEELPNAEISFDRFHVVALANEAMDEVRREEEREDPAAVRAALRAVPKGAKGLAWGMRKDSRDWTVKQLNTMHFLQRSNLKSARAWRLKQGLRTVYAEAVAANDAGKARTFLSKWISWAKRSRLEPFKRLAATLRERFDGVVRGMLDNRTNAYVEAMNGQLQQTIAAARGFRTMRCFIAIAYLRMGKLRHLPRNPMCRAAAT